MELVGAQPCCRTAERDNRNLQDDEGDPLQICHGIKPQDVCRDSLIPPPPRMRATTAGIISHVNT